MWEGLELPLPFGWDEAKGGAYVLATPTLTLPYRRNGVVRVKLRHFIFFVLSFFRACPVHLLNFYPVNGTIFFFR